MGYLSVLEGLGCKAETGYRAAVSVRASGPGITQARPRDDAFARLLKATETDGRTLASLGLAYAGFPCDVREALIEAVLRDTDRPADILAVFLAVEDEPRLAQRLAELLSVRPRAPRPESGAAFQETSDGLQVTLIRPLHGAFAEIMRVRWNDRGLLGIDVESIVHLKELEPLPRIPLSTALDRVTAPLWRHLRKGGPVPEGAERFAGLFSLTEADAETAAEAGTAPEAEPGAVAADAAAGTDAAVAATQQEPG